jgi:hypothetical protein
MELEQSFAAMDSGCGSPRHPGHGAAADADAMTTPRAPSPPDPSDPTPPADAAVAVWEQWRQGPIRRYKGRGKGPAKKPRCCCCFPKSAAGEEVPIGCGVAIVLCADHRDVRFIQSRGGRDFLAAVATMFDSFGLKGKRYHVALTRFVNKVHDKAKPTPRRRPGSYAYPQLREAAEKVWAAGGDYDDGEDVVFRGFLDLQYPSHIPPPNTQTVRRWWRECRWIVRRPGEEPPPPRRDKIVLIDGRVKTILIPPSDPATAPDPADHWLLRSRRRR